MKRIAVFGYSVMTLEVMSRLNADQHSFVFIGKNETEIAPIKALGIENCVIDFRNDEDLKSIGIGSTVDIVFCFYPKDSDNVFLTLSSRAIDKDLLIIAVVDDPESAEKLLAAGANKIVDPYEICGKRTYNMLTKPDITNILDETVFGRHDLNIAQIEIPEGSVLEKTRVSALKLNEKHNLIFIGVVNRELDNDLHFAIDSKDHELNTGDILVVLGPAREIRHFKEEVEHVKTA